LFLLLLSRDDWLGEWEGFVVVLNDDLNDWLWRFVVVVLD
jgi:hypothetical protein